jgi:pimeloyl-ACP methyl ester carboxylesterase
MTEIRLHRPDGTLCGTRHGRGPSILLLHAGGEDRRVWTPVAARLVAAGFAAIAYDLRGHGDSTTGSAKALPALAADVATMLDNLSGGVVVVGASLGGLAALLALADPKARATVAALVLVDVVPDPPPQRTKRFLQAALGTRADEPLVDDILDRAEQLRQIAGDLRIPTLLVRGTASPMSDDDVERFRGLVPTLRVAVIDGCGHMVARDAPADLAKIVIRFARDADGISVDGVHRPCGAW